MQFLPDIILAEVELREAQLLGCKLQLLSGWLEPETKTIF